MGTLSILCYLIFILSAIILIVVVLLQEGKGGGFGGDSLGGHGQQTFGVAAKGIQRFTGITAGVFLMSAIAIHIINKDVSSESVLDGGDGSVIEMPAGDGDTGG